MKGIQYNTGRTWFKKGMTPWNKGVTGYSTTWKGGTHTDKTKLKISKAKKGCVSWCRGVVGWLSDEHKEKIRQANTGRPAWNKGKKTGYLGGGARKGCVPWNKGRPASASERQRLRAMHLKGLAVQQRSKEPTSIEVKVYEELKKRGYLFETQRMINNRFLVDAYIPSLNMVIECDGRYWHSLPSVAKKDKAENAYLTKCGYTVLRLSEDEIASGLFINKLGGTN